MKKIISYILISGFVTIGFISTSCKKDNKCEAGTGGNLTVVAFLKHHGRIIPNDSLRPDTVWVKFNVQDWAGAPSGADTRFIGEAGEDHVHLEGLKCGDYYFYASGWDTTGPYLVTGGQKFSTDQESGEVNFDIAVTE